MSTSRNCVVYARYSSDRQTIQSIEGQITVCKKYAKENNLKILDYYCDEAMTGKNDNREQFQKMLKDSAKKTFSVVLVYALDRFGRNRIEMAINKHTLQKNNVVLISATQKTAENTDGSKNLDGILLESLYEGMAEYYSEELSQKVKRGHRESLKKGNFLGGYYPYGYDIVNKKHVVNELKAPIVRRIFDEYVSMVTVDEIIAGLKKDNIFNDRGKVFSKTSIMKMLSNELYIGNIVYGGERNDNVVPPIIEKTKFELARKRIEKNKRCPGSAKADSPYLLTGKLFCGYCKSKMLGESGTSKTGNVYHYYKCYHLKRRNKCEKKTVSKDYIENKVITDTLYWLHDEDGLHELSHELFIYNKDLIESHSKMDYYQNELKQVNKSIDNLMLAIEQGIITPSTKEKMFKLEQQKSELETHIAKEEFNQSFIIDENDIYEYFKEFSTGNVNDEHFKQKLIDTFIHKVIAYNDKIIIVYNFNGKNEREIDITDITDAFDMEQDGGVRISSCSPRQVKPIRTQTNCFIFEGFVIKVFKT